MLLTITSHLSLNWLWAGQFGFNFQQEWELLHSLALMIEFDLSNKVRKILNGANSNNEITDFGSSKLTLNEG
jgi:hypothetical protein